MRSSACDPKADDSFHLDQKLRVQQLSSQVHFFYRLRREHDAAECALALTGDKNEMAVRFVSGSRSRCMRGKRKLRPGKTAQACDADATDVGAGDAGDAGSS
jgi:hypothetical protein